MNVEKNCYSLIGCLIAGSVIQKNMELSLVYFVFISLAFWSCCLFANYTNIKKQIIINSKLEIYKQDVHNKEIEKILSTIETAFEKQNSFIENELEKVGKWYSDNISKEQIEKRDDLHRIFLEIGNLREENINNIEIGNNTRVENYNKIIEILIDSFDKLQTKIIQNENNIVKSLHEVNMNLNALKERIVSEISMNGNIMRSVVDIICDKLSVNKENYMNELKENINRDFTSLENALRESLKLVSETIGNTISELSENHMGIMSNVQNSLDDMSGNVSSIRSINIDTYSKIEDTNTKLEELGENLTTKVSELSELMSDNIDKQLGIISEQENVLLQYDKIISSINNDVVVKMINDSNNLLKCMKDCYNLLESIRRVRK